METILIAILAIIIVILRLRLTQVIKMLREIRAVKTNHLDYEFKYVNSLLIIENLKEQIKILKGLQSRNDTMEKTIMALKKFHDTIQEQK